MPVTIPIYAMPTLDSSGHYHPINLMCFRCSRNIADILLIWERNPPLKAFCADTALPFGVLAPVDLCHGFQFRINADCFARRSGVQPFAICMLQ